jgi:hypothetical protein
LAWIKWDEYYGLSDKSPVYVVAVVLDPRLKLQYIEKRWRDRPEWIELAKEKLRTILNRYHEEVSPSLVSTAPMLISTAALMRRESMLRHWKYGSSAPTTHREELEDYLRAALELEDIYLIEYWKANKSSIQYLHRWLAISYLSL